MGVYESVAGAVAGAPRQILSRRVPVNGFKDVSTVRLVCELGLEFRDIMSYYDVDAILTDAEKIPCEFQIDVPGLGYLDQSPSHALRAGTRLNLPMWLAEMLALANNSDDDNKPFLTLNLPAALSQDVVQALKADPRAVPLRDQSAHFYGLATRILDLFEERDLAAVLRTAFVRRAAEVSLHARKMGTGGAGVGGSSSGDKKEDSNGSNLGIGYAGQEFLRALDEWERQLFRQTHDGARAGREFLDGVKRNY